MKNLESKEVYFYYVKKENDDLLRMEFGLDYLKLKENYLLEGIFVSDRRMGIPEEKYFEFKRKEMENIEKKYFGKFCRFERDLKSFSSH